MATELSEIQISVGDLELGMYVSRLDRPWEETSFLFQGFMVTSQDEIDALVETCEYVFIEAKSETKALLDERRRQKAGLGKRQSPSLKKTVSTAVNSESLPKKPKTKEPVTYINKIPVEQEFGAAVSSYKAAKVTAKDIMDGIRIGRAIDVNQCRDVVDNIVDSILRNPNALVWLSKIKNKDDYTAEHCMNVCILSVAFARHLGLEQDEIREIGLGALLHDVGKSKVPLEILNKPGRFTDDELEVMKHHTTFGRDLLIAMPNLDYSIVDVAFSHHERVDQMGYPRGLSASQIPYYSKLVSVTDAYDAITSSRVYDNARSSMVALDIIYKNRGTQFDEELALEFIKFIGIYPPGAIVEMTSGEVGIIINSNSDNKLRPRIMLTRDANKNPMQERIVDLTKVPLDSQEQPYLIAAELPNGSHGVDIKDYLDRGLQLKRYE